MRILLVVDVQNDFCPGGALAVPEGDHIIPIVNRLLSDPKFDLRIGTQDWHPSNHVSFAENHPGHKPFTDVTVNGDQQVLWPTHCVQYTWGAQFNAELKASLLDHVIHKGTGNLDSYSAFYENDCKTGTGLVEYLSAKANERGETLADIELVVCGLALDYCVKWSALDAARLGIKTSVCLDATRAVALSINDEVKSLRELKESGVEILQSREILNENGRRQQREISQFS